MWWLVFAVVALVAWWFRKVVQELKYWSDRGVKQKALGSMLSDFTILFSRKYSLADIMEQMYNEFPESRYSGIYQFFRPILVIRDPDLIRQITVKDFDHFVDHRSFIREDVDPIFARNLVSLTGRKWREMRATLSPSFTSSKMRFIFSLILQNGEKFSKYFLDQNEDIITVEMKDTCMKFANDVIANTAFGIECDTLVDPNNEFYLSGRKVAINSGFRMILKLLGFALMPKLFKVLNISFLPGNMVQFFSKTIKNNIESREKNGIVRPDMIHLLLETRKNKAVHEESPGQNTIEEPEVVKNPNQKLKLTDEDIIAQAILFFIGGFESVSTSMSFVAYELGVNPDIQERLTREVDETLEACNLKLTYEGLLGMKYMDMVVSESLRKWPSAVATDRVCTKAYTIEPKTPDETPFHIEEGVSISLPIFGIHRDPQYYPEPERFDPERFNDENKKKIEPYTYMPFGLGPRNCIGSRFALLEIKILLFYILAHFQIVPVEKTQIPLVLSKKQFSLIAENGTWLGLKRRAKL